MTSILKRSALLAAGFAGTLALGSTFALAEAGHAKHGTADAKIIACHEMHTKMKDGKMDASHMKGCHDKDGKLIGNADGHMGKDMKMPMGDHDMKDHKKMGH